MLKYPLVITSKWYGLIMCFEASKESIRIEIHEKILGSAYLYRGGKLMLERQSIKVISF